jgi:chromate transporter
MPRSPLLETVLVLARLGATAFGGPAAHVALQEAECVRKRRWCDHRHFLDLVAVASLIPGPTSTEVAIHLGRMRAGWPGLVLGGLAWMAPGTLMVLGLAWAYVQWGRVPAAVAVLEALRPAVLVVIGDALRRLAPTAVRDRRLAAWAVAGAALALAGASDVALVFVALAVGLALGGPAPSRLRAVPLLELFGVFCWIGATLFGSGYVLISYLEDALGARGWLDGAQLLDAVAVGQITPGPLFSTATFVGYLLGGMPGALVATAGIFLPSFCFVALTGPLVERWRGVPRVRGALDVVNAVVVGLIAAVLVRLAPQALALPFQWLVAAAALGLVAWRGSSTAALAGALALGVVRALLA